MSASNKSLVTITENESKNLRLLPDKLNIGPTHFIRVQFEYILDNVDALLAGNKHLKKSTNNCRKMQIHTLKCSHHI